MLSTKQVIKGLDIKVQEAAKQSSTAIQELIDKLQKIYASYRIQFRLEKQYAHRVIMALMSPVNLAIKQSLGSTPYFTINNKDFTSRKFSPFSQFMLSVSQAEPQFKTPPISTLQDKDTLSTQNIPTITPKPAIKQPLVKSIISYPLFKEHEPSEGDTIKSPGKHKTALGNDAQQEMSDWVINQIINGNTVTKSDLLGKALSMKKTASFTASRTWLRSYFKRYPYIKTIVLASQRNKMKHHKHLFEGEDFSDELSNHPLNSVHQSSQGSGDTSNEGKGQQSQILSSGQRTFWGRTETDIEDPNVIVYDDGQERIIIDKAITNEIKQSRYTPSSRYKKSFVNGNGYIFKNHSRFKNEYFDMLKKMREENKGMIVFKSKQYGGKCDRQKQFERGDITQISRREAEGKTSLKKKGEQKEKQQECEWEESEKQSRRKSKKEEAKLSSKDEILKRYLHHMRWETVKNENCDY